MVEGHILIIGEAKCGTSSMYKHLTQHPRIMPAVRRNPSSKHVGATNYFNRIGEPNLEDYHKRLVTAEGNFFGCDVSPSYFRTPSVPQKVRSLLPHPFLILMLREPAERIYSNYWMNLRQGVEEGSFKEVVDHGYLRSPTTKYTENLARWYEHFSPNDLLIVKSEAFFEEPKKTMTEVLKFFGMEWAEIDDWTPVVPHGNDSKPGEHYPPMTPAAREFLNGYFKEEKEKLYHMTGLRWT